MVSESVYMTRNEKSPLSHVDSYTLGLFWQTTADFRTKFMNPLVLPLKSHSFISPRTRHGGQVFNMGKCADLDPLEWIYLDV